MFQNIKNKLNTIFHKFGFNLEPSFSFIMPTYNRAFCIENAINSLIKQDYPNWELIIVDDGSNDGTENLIHQKYRDLLNERKIIYTKAEHKGTCAARNVGLSLAKNKWIGYLDTDNEMVSDYLISYKTEICKHRFSKCFYAQIKLLSGEIVGVPFNYKKLRKGNYIDLGVFIHHKSLIKKYGNFDEKINRLVDWELILRYTKNNKPIFINKPLLKYNNSNDFTRISNSENYEEAYNYIKAKY